MFLKKLFQRWDWYPRSNRLAGFLVLGAVAPLLSLVAFPSAAQLSPSGYTGAINTPTADVTEAGTIVFSFTNSIPERGRDFPNDGLFGGLNLGFGLLPGLEAIGRLAFDGDLNCDLYQQKGPCAASIRDLSVGAKYQLPLKRLPFDSRLAVGLSDYGGAATNFRQVYGVGTSSLGPIDLSLGFSKAPNAVGAGNGLMDGAFGSLVLRINDRLRLLLENDTRETRIGIATGFQPSASWQVAAGVSTKLTNNSPQQKNQVTLTATYFIDGKAQSLARAPFVLPAVRSAPATKGTAPQPSASNVITEGSYAPHGKSEPMNPSKGGPLGTNASRPDLEVAHSIANALSSRGFWDISIGQVNNQWLVRAEPRGWRKNRMDALAAGMAAWLEAASDQTQDVFFTLTYLRQPVMHVKTSTQCIRDFTAGMNHCESSPQAIQFFSPENRAELPLNGRWIIEGYRPQSLWPDFELGPAAGYAAGTEYGLFDYSLGYAAEWEIPFPWVKGLSWQGSYTRRLYDTDDFASPGGYFRVLGLAVNTGLNVNQLVYVHPIFNRLWLEAHSGQLSPTTDGSGLAMSWVSESGFLRLNAIAGRYSLNINRGPRIVLLDDLSNPQPSSVGLKPELVTARLNLIPGRWRFLYSQGRFLNNDPGFMITSSHNFGDQRINFFYRKTGPGNFRTPKRTAFAGFLVTFPLGPKQSSELGPVTVRGKDRWFIGLETKVQEKDNYIELHYGLAPSPRHGLFGDVLDYDRADLGSLVANQYRLRSSLREQLGRHSTSQ
jgi:hypothetical protein